eukprot:403358085
MYELFAIQCILKMGYDSITTTISAVLGEMIAVSLVGINQYSEYRKYMNPYPFKGLPLLFNSLWKKEKNYYLIQMSNASLSQNSNIIQNEKQEVQAVEIEFYNVKFDEEDCILLQLKNITQILNSEKEKIQTHYQEMLIATISHEVMNPLNSIVNLSSIAESQYQSANVNNLQDAFPVMKSWSSFFSIINSSSKQVYYLVKSCMDIQLIKNHKFNQKVSKQKPIDIIKNIYNIFRIQINEKQIKFQIEYKDDLEKQFNIDWDRYQQILINIMQNAVKFTIKGSIIVSVQIDEIEGGIYMISTSVKDTGIGMSEEVLNSLFQTFNNKSSQDHSVLCKNGIGVGLSICYDLIKALNGEISVQSELEKGTQVTFTLKFLQKLKLPKINISRKFTSNFKQCEPQNDVESFQESPQPIINKRKIQPKDTPNFYDNDNSNVLNQSNIHLLNNQQKHSMKRNTTTEIRSHNDQINKNKSLINQAQNQCLVKKNEKLEQQIKQVKVNVGKKEKQKYEQQFELSNFQVKHNENGLQDGGQGLSLDLRLDDNIFNLITLEFMLKDQSELIVDKANNGLEAVEMFKSNLLNKECCNQHYRLILMDLNMPVMDGYEATDQIIQLAQLLQMMKIQIIAIRLE